MPLSPSDFSKLYQHITWIDSLSTHCGANFFFHTHAFTITGFALGRPVPWPAREFTQLQHF
jgi:hypothetical protein